MIAALRETLGGRDPSLPIALAAALRRADAVGSVSFHDLAVAYREAYLEVRREEWGDGLAQRGVLSVDDARHHLAASVLPRLVGDGLLADLPQTFHDETPIRLHHTVWGYLGADRAAATAELMAIALDAVRATESAGAVVAPTGSTLEARGLTKSYRRRRVVDGVELEVRQGEIVGLLGPNGAGKTTSFYMMVGLVRPDAGRIYLDGEDISALPMYQRARRGVGYLAQEPSIFRKLSVEDNVLAILETLKLSAAERAQRLERLLDDLSIKHLRTIRAYKLSGGERRRLEITRALVTQPKFLLLDEPFTGVDPIAVNDIQTIVAGLRRRGIGVLITDHNVDQTLDIVDRAYIMFEGKVQVAGTVRELVFDDVVADKYFGPILTARLRERLGTTA